MSLSSPRELKPRSDRSVSRYGRLCGGARPPQSPESCGHQSRGRRPPLPGAPAPVSGPGPDQGHHEHPERTPGTNTQMRRLRPSRSMQVWLPQSTSACSPGRLEPHGLHPVAVLYDAATRRTPVWNTTATAFRPDLPAQCHAVSQPLRRPTSDVRRPTSNVPGVRVAASMPARTGDRPHALRPVQILTLRRLGVPSTGVPATPRAPAIPPTERPAPFISRVSFTCPAFRKVRRPPPRRLRE